MIDTLYNYGTTHWPFVAFAFVAMLVNQVIKTAVFTKKRAHTKGKFQWFWWWTWKTLALYPVIVGGLTGLIWRNPENASPVWPLIASVFYFALAGTLSVWLYQLLKGIAKKRGFNLDNLSGQEEPPKQ